MPYIKGHRPLRACKSDSEKIMQISIVWYFVTILMCQLNKAEGEECKAHLF